MSCISLCLRPKTKTKSVESALIYYFAQKEKNDYIVATSNGNNKQLSIEENVGIHTQFG